MSWLILYILCVGSIEQDVRLASVIDKTYYVETTLWVTCGRQRTLEYYTTYKIPATDTAFIKNREYKKALERKKKL